MKRKLRNILVTGGLGFIGSNFIDYFLKTNPDSMVSNIDKATYASRKNLCFDSNERYSFIEGDITDFNLLNDVISTNKYDLILNFAAETHVDNSIKNPKLFFETNVIGTLNLVECVKKT